MTFVVLTSVASLNITVHKFANGYLASAVWGVVLSVVGVVLFTSGSRSLRYVLSSRAFWIGGILLLTAGDVLRYPYQSRKPNFESAAPALIDSARELAAGRNPYLAESAIGAPISAGPGWIVLLMPLTLSGCEVLINPLCAAACAFLISRRSRFGAGVFVLLLLLQPNYLGRSTAGHDLYAIPIAFAVLCLLAEEAMDRVWMVSLLAVIASAFATSRLPMIVPVVILCLGLFRRKRRTAALFALIVLPLSILWHATFYLWARKDGIFYQPMHLVNRANWSGGWFTAIGLAGACGVCAWVLFRMTGDVREWMLGGTMFLVAAFVPVAVGELVMIGFQFGSWEGGSYLCFGMSLLIAVLALSTVAGGCDGRAFAGGGGEGVS